MMYSIIATVTLLTEKISLQPGLYKNGVIA
jgi:hypothetical protein